jgi:excisionase family DNA binding protein
MNKQLLTVKDVMKILRISRPVLHNLTKEGKISMVRVGGSVRYQESDVQEFIERMRKEPVEESN